MLILKILKKIYIRFKAILSLSKIKYLPEKKFIILGDSKREKDLYGNIPKKIWIYWDSNKKNHLVDLCITNIRRINFDYDVVILNRSNIFEYIDNINMLYEKNLKPAIIADYIRLYLIKNYGGIWMDASILMTQNFEWIYKELRSGVFLFYSDDCTIDLKKPIVENWFIMAEKDNEFISDWLKEFKKCVFSENPYKFYEDYADNQIIQNIPNTDYLMCYISAAIVMSKKNYNITCLNSGSSGHYYNYKLISDDFAVALAVFFKNKNNIYTTELIKYTKDTRDFSDLLVRKKIYLKNSIIASVMQRCYESDE